MSFEILKNCDVAGEPKAIPWSHISPLRCGMDGWGHQDIRSGDVIAWPTNLGWMMGPFVVFAALLNGGAMAVYNGSPLGRGYGKFMQVSDNRNILGVHYTILSQLWSTSLLQCLASHQVAVFLSLQRESFGEPLTVF